MYLDRIAQAGDLKKLKPEELAPLCQEIRDFLVEAVSKTGGHLGSNLGVVELTVAMHRVFDSPRDALVFDTGHQTYVHKMLTGRTQGFDNLRQLGGMSGYPSREESAHDLVENSHASTGLSYALALATARRLQGIPGKVVSVVGDGSLTGGMAYEALNNIGEQKPNLLIVLNDNGRSYAPTVGGLAEHLGHLRLSPKYEASKRAVAHALGGLPALGDSAVRGAKRVKDSLKQLVAPASIFETLGIKYGGPIDGHDVLAVERALQAAAKIKGPVVVHVVTEKGHGYRLAEHDEVDRYHGVPAFDPALGVMVKNAPAWTDLFGEALLELAESDKRVVAITAAMASSTGLLDFAKRYPDRFFDVGIAEQHAVTFAAGLAMQGLRPVVCIYSTFLQRAFDQVMCDVALHNLPVIFVLDRSGITGDDGASHHGAFDMAYLRAVPGMTICAPSSPEEMRRMLATGLQQDHGPFAMRYPRGAAPVFTEVPLSPLPIGKVSVVREGNDVVILAVGKMVPIALAAAESLQVEDIYPTVVDGRFIKPIDVEIADIAREHSAIVTVEDGVYNGGFGSAVLELLAVSGVQRPVQTLGLPDRFIEHGAQGKLLKRYGLDIDGVVQAVRRASSRAGTPRFALVR